MIDETYQPHTDEQTAEEADGKGTFHGMEKVVGRFFVGTGGFVRVILAPLEEFAERKIRTLAKPESRPKEVAPRRGRVGERQ
jgi:hypothetical protein